MTGHVLISNIRSMGTAVQKIIEQAQDRDFLALLLARNRCGPALPIHELLARNSIPEHEFDAAAADPSFEPLVAKYQKELVAEGFGVEAKAAVLHEAGLTIVYDILRDGDQPAAARLKAHEMLGDIAGTSKKAKDPTLLAPGGNAYQLIINLGGSPGEPARVETFTAPAKDVTPPPVLPAATEDSDEAAAYADI